MSGISRKPAFDPKRNIVELAQAVMSVAQVQAHEVSLHDDMAGNLTYPKASLADQSQTIHRCRIGQGRSCQLNLGQRPSLALAPADYAAHAR
jgi:hypothetical protein